MTEHFRCVPPIIEFNNHLSPSYGGRLEPLRRPSPQEILDPPIQAVYVEDGYKNNNDINEPEAERLVESVVNLCQDPRYALPEVISGSERWESSRCSAEKQAKHISRTSSRAIQAWTRGKGRAQNHLRRRLRFSGRRKGRDVPVSCDRDQRAILAPGQRRRPTTIQRRHEPRQRSGLPLPSVQLRDINNPECVRHKLLQLVPQPAQVRSRERVSSPPSRRRTANSSSRSEKASSAEAIPSSHNFARFRETLSTGSIWSWREDSRVAIECDGDRWPGDEKVGMTNTARPSCAEQAGNSGASAAAHLSK